VETRDARLAFCSSLLLAAARCCLSELASWSTTGAHGYTTSTKNAILNSEMLNMTDRVSSGHSPELAPSFASAGSFGVWGE
jgi:hypothetical protein